MSTPHEYFDKHGNPHNECKGNSALYEDVDAIANECDDQLPGVSTIGRGPRGDSWNPEILENTDDTFKFDLVNDRTDEHYPEDAPNLHAGKLVSNVEEIDDKKFLVLTLYRGGSEVWNRSIELPQGPDGSYSFIYEGEPIRISDAWVASIPIKDLILTNIMPEEQPAPRNYDIVFANIIDPDTYIDPYHYDVRFAVGVIYATSGANATVVFRSIITGSGSTDVNIFEIVDELPSEGALNKIYSVPKPIEDQEPNNTRNEWYFVNGQWEQFGFNSREVPPHNLSLLLPPGTELWHDPEDGKDYLLIDWENDEEKILDIMYNDYDPEISESSLTTSVSAGVHMEIV